MLETFRGKGIYQKAVDTAIVKLNEGRWVSVRIFVWRLPVLSLPQVHLFGEGKVNQPYQYPINEEGVTRLPRFKWGTYVYSPGIL